MFCREQNFCELCLFDSVDKLRVVLNDLSLNQTRATASSRSLRFMHMH